jgi:flagellar biosynthetic protein FliR
VTVDITPLVSGRAEAFVLLFVRISTLFMVAPIFGNRVIPVKVRVLAALVLAAALLPLVPAVPLIPAASAAGFGLLIANEVTLGLLLGLVASVAFFGVQVAGQLAGLQMGFGIANVLDPQSESQVAVTAEFQNLLFLLVFLALDGHHVLLRALKATLDRIPLGGFTLGVRTMEIALRESAEVFAIALRVGAPVIAFLFVTSLGLGIIARTVPQLNIFVLGFPLQIAGGLVVLLFALPAFRIVFEELTRHMEGSLLAVVGVR